MPPSSVCNVEILTVGNELLLGNTVNTNASWIAKQLTSLGATVTRITTVPDDLGAISAAIREALERKPNFIITTGGIGPTFDDMTLKGVGKALDLRLRLDRTAVEMIRHYYRSRLSRRRVGMTKPRLKMATLPVGGVPIRNPVGTAPGLWLHTRRTEIFCLPGVPREAKAIFRTSLSQAISAAACGSTFTQRWLRVHGIMESTLAPIIDRVMRKWPGVYIKSHPRGVEASGRPHIELHISISSSDQIRAEKILKRVMEALRDEISKLRGRID